MFSIFKVFSKDTNDSDIGSYLINYSVSDSVVTVTKTFTLNVLENPCLNVTCEDYCDGEVLYSNGYCSVGICYHSPEEGGPTCELPEVPQLNITLVNYPSEVIQNKMFNFTIELTCNDPSGCNDVWAALDPQKEYGGE